MDQPEIDWQAVHVLRSNPRCERSSANSEWPGQRRLRGGYQGYHQPKYALHDLRHFYASWCINRERDGGLELPLKMVQERLGHSTLAMTADTYGHLFPNGDDGTELARAEKFFLA